MRRVNLQPLRLTLDLLVLVTKALCVTFNLASAGNLGFKRLSACAKQCEAELKTQGKLPELLNDELQQHIKQVIAFIIEQGSTNVEKSQGTDC